MHWLSEEGVGGRGGLRRVLKIGKKGCQFLELLRIREMLDVGKERDNG